MPSVQLLPKTSNPRPTLPSKWNKLLADVDPKPLVKFQTITKDGADVVVGRVKVSTPPTQSHPDGSHAYVLRRYDSGFISWTTMWRATFPLTKPADEKDDIAWVRANYDIKTGVEKEVMRLAGVWIPPDLAKVLAPSYHLNSIVAALVDAYPDNTVDIPSAKYPPRSSHTTTPAGPNKRRKETHESPATATPINGTNETLSAPASTSKVRKAKSPVPSRSTPSRTVKARKTASPAPPAPPEASARPKKPDSDKEDTRSTPRRRSAVAKKPATKRDESDDEEVSKAPLPIPEEDIAESQNLVQRLKEEAQHTIVPITQTVKRTRDEAEQPVTLNIAEHSQEVVPVPVEERAVVTNRRVQSRWPSLPALDPNQKAAAWGTIAFAIGWGATTFLPQFF